MTPEVREATANLEEAMRRAVEERKIPGIVIAAGNTERLLLHRHYGWAQLYPGKKPLGLDSVWDLASLTKVVATTTVTAALASGDALTFDDPISQYLPEFGDRPPSKATVRHLMTHTAGFHWWRPFHQTCRTSHEVLAAIFQEELDYEPGTSQRYSDMSYILLGEIVSRVSGLPLDWLARELVFSPLDMVDTTFRPGPGLQERCVSTEIEEGESEPVVGVVHDENARAMGGVAGHAGLFSTSTDLARFAQCLLRIGEGSREEIISPEVWEEVMTRNLESAASDRWLGWCGISPDGFLADTFSQRAFGHTGFTGTALWADPGEEGGFFVTVLTNGVHPKRRDDDAVMKTRKECYQAALRVVRAYREVEW